VARARFPEGTTGAQVDVLARKPLWEKGLDYAHGTGHGVGCYLSVHEEAASLSPKGQAALKPGMLLSNEPGYYKEGAYGIRIESLVFVRESGRCADTGKPMLGFETVSLAPFDRRLIVKTLLNAEEIGWVDAYHARVREILAARLDPQAAAFLAQACRPL
jgi:Xaa-Pro aminopeptidase